MSWMEGWPLRYRIAYRAHVRVNRLAFRFGGPCYIRADGSPGTIEDGAAGATKNRHWLWRLNDWVARWWTEWWTSPARRALERKLDDCAKRPAAL